MRERSLEKQGNPERVETLETNVQESVWIEIIRRMEALYAQLADSQAEIEKRAKELGEAKELGDNIIRSMSSALIALDAAGAIVLANDATEQLFGYVGDELIGGPLDRLLPESGGEQWRWAAFSRRVQQPGGIREVETAWQNREGTLLPVAVTSSPLRDPWGGLVGAVVVVRDLRETKRRIEEVQAAMAAAKARAQELERANAELKLLQAELIQAAKMSSLGRLAAGVAHELNNPLGGILLYSDLLLEDTAEEDARRSNVAKISELAGRCRQIVRELLDFARPTPSSEGEVDVNRVLRSTLGVMEKQEAFHNVKVEWDLAGEAPLIPGDTAQLQQAFTNVVINAVEAMGGSGTLGISTRPTPEGDGVAVRISDTGCGIRKEDIEHLFEPFFTTKDDGTGLGLAITYSIVERHNGGIEVESALGKGTTFVLTLRAPKNGETKGGGPDA